MDTIMGRWSGNIGLLVLAMLWGTMVPTIGHLLQTWDPLFLAAFRYLGTAPVLLPVLWMRERGRANVPRPPQWKVWLLGVVGIGGYAALYTVGVHHANLVTASILSAASPAVATITDWLIFRRLLDRRMVPGLILAIVGCILATVDFARAGNPFDLRGGEILILAAFACWSWYSSAAQRWLHGWSQIRISAVTMSMGGVGLSVVYLIAAGLGAASFPPPAPGNAMDVFMMLWLTLVLVATGVFLWNYGVKRSGVVVASLYLNLTPIVAIAILAIWGGVVPNWQQMVGGALVIVGILFAELRMMKSRPLPEVAEPAHS
jgi:drug/metabolite transporter (DMT)-like permease